MPGIRDTAYPELKSAPSAKELAEVYTPTFVELVWAEKRTREPSPRVGLLALLKTFRYDAGSVRRRHMLLIRDYAGVKAWGEDAQTAIEKASEDAARTLEDLPDIINVLLEQLVRQRFELPAFSVLQRAAQHARAVANREYQSLVCDRIDAAARQRLGLKSQSDKRRSV
jgi:hypothetical protein